jgi:hypothetical protein
MFEFDRLELLFMLELVFVPMFVLVLIGVDVGNGVAFVITPTFEFAFRIFAFRLTFVSPHADINAPIDVSAQASRIFLICGLLSNKKMEKRPDRCVPSLRSAGRPFFGLRRSRPLP